MEPDQAQIRRLAYKIWEAGGRRPDSQMDDWLRAEQQIRAMGPSEDAQQSAAADEAESDWAAEPDTPAARIAEQMFTRKCQSG